MGEVDPRLEALLSEAVRRGADEKMGDRFDRILRSREPDALQAVAAARCTRSKPMA